MFDTKNVTIQTEKAAKVQAKSQENIAKMQMNQAKKQAKRELIREKKQNQEGIYKKIGPFTIKTYLIMAVIFVLGIMMLVDKINGGGSEAQKTDETKQESVMNDQ